MISITSRVLVKGLTGTQVSEFLLNPSDDAYRAWWPGTHLAFHRLDSAPGHVGETVFMDEYVGRRRLRMKCRVALVEPGRIRWRVLTLPRLPAWLDIQLEDLPQGVSLTHVISAGWGGIGMVFDPLIRIFLSKRFRTDMDEHARIEFPRLADLLAGSPGKG